MSHPADRLVDLALGSVGSVERAALEEHLAACGACRDELEKVRAAVADLPLGLARREPVPGVRAELAARVRGDARFWPFLGRLARLFDLSDERAERLVRRIDDPSAWASDALVQGGEVMLVSPGSRLEGAIASLIRLPEGARYPRHRHLGEERLLFLQGGVALDDGSLADAGSAVESGPGSSHGFRVLPGGPCLAAVLVVGGVELELG